MAPSGPSSTLNIFLRKITPDRITTVQTRDRSVIGAYIMVVVEILQGYTKQFRINKIHFIHSYVYNAPPNTPLLSCSSCAACAFVACSEQIQPDGLWAQIVKSLTIGTKSQQLIGAKCSFGPTSNTSARYDNTYSAQADQSCTPVSGFQGASVCEQLTEVAYRLCSTAPVRYDNDKARIDLQSSVVACVGTSVKRPSDLCIISRHIHG